MSTASGGAKLPTLFLINPQQDAIFGPSGDAVNDSETTPNYRLKPERNRVETAEMLYLGLIVITGVVLNLRALRRLLQQSSRSPTALTSFLFGPYHISTHEMFKLHLRYSSRKFA